MNKHFSLRKTLTATLVASACVVGWAPTAVVAAEADIAKRLDALEAELAALKAQVARPAPAAAPASAQAAKERVVSGTDGITVYGKLELAAEANKDGVVSRNLLQNISSNIGFRGQRRLTGDLTGLMQIETGIAPDDSANSKTFASRNSFAGLRSDSLGSLIVGTYDMPLKRMDGNVDIMWGNADATEIILEGAGTSRQSVTTAGASYAPFSGFHTRQKNVIQYWSPKFSNIEIKLAFSPDEVNGVLSGTTTTAYRKPVYGASVEFDNKVWQFGVATETMKNFTADGKNMTALMAQGGMKLGDLAFGLAYSQLDNHLNKKTSNWVLGAAYDISLVSFKLNYGESSETADGKNDGLKMLGLEVDYPFDKNTVLFGYYSKITNGANARGRFEGGDNKFSPVAGTDPTALGLGIRFKF